MNFLSVGLLFSTFFAVQSDAGVLHARVVHLVPGANRTEDTLVMLSDGRVLRTTDEKMVKDIGEASKYNESLTLVESNHQLITFAKTEALNNPILDQYYDNSLPSFSAAATPTNTRYTDADFAPTNLKNMSDAQRLMDPLKLNEKSKSECYQRAHFWALEMKQMANIQSEKVFLFFSTKYQREYKFHWWFHVAPFVLVNNSEYVIDQSFFDKPADMQSWTNFFMPAHPICKTVSNYADYDNHQEEEYCFLRKVPMYYYDPASVEARDQDHTVISDWIDYQVVAAYETLLPWWKR